jgi:uncharacterized membrane protein HdeD (DUF308 family)
MSYMVAWSLFALGVVHIAFGLIKFRAPLAAAVTAGIIGQFKVPESRSTAFWFLISGPALMLSGHTAVHAVTVDDIALLKIVGTYMLVSSIVGVTAFPKSPFWALLLLSLLLVAAGYGMLP